MRIYLYLAALLLSSPAGATPIRVDTQKLITDARQQIGVTVTYDPAYRRLTYPGGDVPGNTGVCSDVIVRALRQQNIDLQQLLHEDMKKNFPQYPQRWGLKKTDPNIDHRRVPNLMTFLTRTGNNIPTDLNPKNYHPGDIVTWNLTPAGFLPHIGIVSDRLTPDGTPFIIHNIGAGTREEPGLFQYPIIGHYRL